MEIYRIGLFRALGFYRALSAALTIRVVANEGMLC